MQLIYEGKDITSEVEIQKADLTDNAGGELDSLELQFNDPKGLWSQWKPEKNHILQIKESGFDTGVMYIDEILQHRGVITIKALPIKQEAKTANTKSWENVRFLGIAQELSLKNGLTLQTYNIQDRLYSSVDQSDEADLSFFAWRCLIEGYSLKASNLQLIIYDEAFMEKQAPARKLYLSQTDGDFTYRNKSNEIYGACRISSSNQEIKYTFKPDGIFGPILKYGNFPLTSIGEAERFSKGLLRSKNKYEKALICTIRLDTGIAGGNTIEAIDFGLANGIYLAHQVIHKFVEKRTVLKMRRPLIGY